MTGPVLFLDHSAAMFAGYSDGSLYTPYQDGKIMLGGNKQEVPDEEVDVSHVALTV
jgi:hypothetical protein